MKNFSLKLIPGDGIGIEVMHEGLRVLRAIEDIHGGITFSCQELDWSCRYYLDHGSMMPHDGLEILSQCDAILLLSLIHISEPTRLLSISYAVFCLKKKNKQCYNQ